MKMSVKFALLGLLLVSIWFVSFVSAGQSDAYTAALGLSFTSLFVYFLQREYGFQLARSEKIALCLFPVIYIILVYYTLAGNNFFGKNNAWVRFFYVHLINPLNIGLILLILGLTVLKDITKPVAIFVVTYTVLLYSHIFYKDWKKAWFGNDAPFYSEMPSSSATGMNMHDLDEFRQASLFDFSFINPDLDTVLLSGTGNKYILLETFPENCPPCLKAMKELPSFYREIKETVDVYYVYENRKESSRNEFKRIFEFEAVAEKSRILVDIEQHFYKTFKMEGYPYFLLFDSNGKLVYYTKGYPGKDRLTSDILRNMQLAANSAAPAAR